MTNYEHYKEQIEKITRLGLEFGIDKTTGEFDYCSLITCTDCKFFGGCCIKKIKWADDEYKEPEPEVDWSKVPIDTPILVKTDKHSGEWTKRYFAGYADGKVYAWNYGRTSWTSYTPDAIVEWGYAKLAEVDND